MAGYRIDIKSEDKGRVLTVPCGITFIQLGALIDIAMGYDGGGTFASAEDDILGMADIDEYMDDRDVITYESKSGSCRVVCTSADENYDRNFAVCEEVSGDHANAFVISSNLKNVLFVRKDNDIEHDDFTVWEDAEFEEWKRLYELGDEIEKSRPWDTFTDLDIISVPTQGDNAYITVMGSEGINRGIAVFFGEEGLNDYFLVRMSSSLGIDSDYAMFSQNCITAYWGKEDDMLPDQLRRLARLGMDGRGEGRSLYFMSFEDGYFPYDLDRGQVVWMTEIFERILDALRQYRERKLTVEFDSAVMYFADRENGVYEGRKWPIPGLMIKELVCPEEAAVMLTGLNRTGQVLEFDVFPTGMPIKMDTKPESPKIIAAVNVSDKRIVLSELTAPDRITDIQAFEALAKWMSMNGIPKRIKVSSPVVESMISDLCRRADIDLRRVDTLVNLGTVKQNLLQYIRNGGR